MSKRILQLSSQFKERAIEKLNREFGHKPRLSFNGDPAIPFPVIGCVYRVNEFANKNDGSTARPMILVGYYMRGNQSIALDFICPTSRPPRARHGYDINRYDLVLPKYQFANFIPKDLHIPCHSIMTVPNNKEIILGSLPIDRICPRLLADYLLRRALILREQEGQWRKCWDLSESLGSVRHGFLFDQLPPSICNAKDRFLPDQPNAKHGFGHSLTGPTFIRDNFSAIQSWAIAAAKIKRHAGLSVDLPDHRLFPEWPSPTKQLTTRSAQLAYMHGLSRN
ncbi:MAG: hypothetical protein DI586_00525 [Micavibrio aeruginosavorus]|uniref:Uncharacterized protein n=1 Tax=Micavibrio aeruginosavorus TaxID=349221 RepID=A0A2W5HUU5_9BACT|nr:MAG: hypothetical protein DI586_00525 [Micavibrio aeruginosavorus]